MITIVLTKKDESDQANRSLQREPLAERGALQHY